MQLGSKAVYLDNSSASRPSGEAISRMLPFFSDKWGSPTQPHQIGQEVVPPLKEALKNLYALLGAHDEDAVIITSSQAESISQAFLATYEEVTLSTGKNHFIASAADDAAALLSLARVERYGCPVTKLKANSRGVITPESVAEVLSPRTALVSISWVNGLTGVVQPIREIAELCELRGVRLLVDATHALGKYDISVQSLPLAYVSFNGPELHAPQGTGGLYIKKGVKTTALIAGGLEQGGLRGGTVNVPGFVALGTAAKLALEARDYVCTEVSRMKFHFESEVKRRIPKARILFEQEERAPHISAIAFPGLASEALLFLLNRKNVFASMGGGSFPQMKYLLDTMGLNPFESNAALSFSLSRETTDEDLDLAVEALVYGTEKLFKSSKGWTDGL
ncbi:MAG: cysteine desulfurase family protein [Parachlamydiaceae bacterium]